MIYSKLEYSLTNKPIDSKILAQIQPFLIDDEEILYTFDGYDIVAIFSSKKIIFVCTASGDFCETEFLPYHSITRCTTFGSPNAKHSKLELAVSDDIIVTFCLPAYDDAAKLCRIITK